MKSWVKPVTEVQKFEANEYVAACWGVGCDVSWSNDYEKGMVSPMTLRTAEIPPIR